MTSENLPDRAPGKYVPYGQRACYLPADLPPDDSFEFGSEFEDTLQETIFQLGRLEGISHQSTTSPLLYTTLVRREAVESVLIEGGQLTLEDVFRSSELSSESTVMKDIQEALNYERVIQEGSELVSQNHAISIELLQELHAILLKNARGEAENPGEFRTHPSHIPSPVAGMEPFVPPTPDRIRPLMANLVEFIHSDGTHHDLLDIGIVHYQFETIHPFADGNGRLGRILITLQLLEDGYLSEPYLYPSAYFNEHKVEYAKRMRAVSEEGAWEEWLAFFVDGIRRQAEEAVARTELLQDLRRTYENRYGHEKTASDRLAMRLFEQPYITIQEAGELLEMSDQSARNAVRELEAEGVLEEVTGKDRYQEFKAVDIFEVLNEPIQQSE